ncbi:ATP-binding protein [Streptomyces sp. NPDC005078]|uniref:ATP-binding protein n=1 Tax=unclassified Streptomyces TaxID=2593676 RepID=UPI0033A087F8
MQADIETAASALSFSQLLSSTPRGARLARLLAEQQFADWGLPRRSETIQDATLIVAELAANAVRHGRIPGRDFRLTLVLRPDGHVRISVTDARAEQLPEPVANSRSSEQGRGLLIVAALADRWGVERCSKPPANKTVWAELAAVQTP